MRGAYLARQEAGVTMETCCVRFDTTLTNAQICEETLCASTSTCRSGRDRRACCTATAHDDQIVREQTERAAAAYLLKPFEGRALLALVDRVTRAS